jgi:hypothetical protein
VQAVQQDVYASRVPANFHHQNVKQPLFVKNIPFFVMGPNSQQTALELLAHSRIFPATILNIPFQATTKYHV